MSTYPFSRRAFLSAVASLGVTALAPLARADGSAPDGASPPPAAPPPSATASGSRVTRVTRDERGVTLMLELAHAPFPAPGSVHRDPSVLVFVPKHHRAGPGGATHLVVHFHGHNSTAPRATAKHQLREQLFDSKQNAILVVPEVAVLAADSSAGKLESPGAFARLLDDVLATLDTREARVARTSSSNLA
ncbi:MAG TPA: hypothetical protein VM204_04175, partial [Gaiellaceae bacterium]|nr:hypothetical protein [Gaiellaceae bacterium]